MPKIVNNEVYLDTNETAAHLTMSRQNFYRDARKRLHVYTFDGKRQPYYKRDEVLALAEGRLEERPHIVIRGLLKEWTTYARGLGLNVETVNCLVEIGVPLSRPTCSWLGVPHETAFVSRQRISFVDGVPICVWESHYPLALVSPFLERLKHDETFDVPATIKESRGIVPHTVKERHIARLASVTEQELLQLRRPDAVLQLQRAAYSELGKLIFYSDMTLLGSWFEPEISYPVDIW